MLVVTAQIWCVPGQEDAFIAAAAELVAKTVEEPGNIIFAVSRDILDASRFAFVEEWRDDAALDEHVETTYFKAFTEAARTMIDHRTIEIHTVEKTRTV